MTKNKFKVGDRVVMVDTKLALTGMVEIGNKGTVLALRDRSCDVFVDWDDAVSVSSGTLHGCKPGHGWWVYHASLGLENAAKENKPTHVIVMKYDGDKTTAIEKVGGKIVAKAEAHRNPADDASSSIGFKLAFERLMEEVAKEDESKKKSPKSKFTIDDIHEGDLVKIKSDLIVDKWYGSHMFVSCMLTCKSKTDEVYKVFPYDNSFRLKLGGCYFTPEMVEEVYHASGRN